jgi:uncharacterized protein (TIGR02453 family)
MSFTGFSERAFSFYEGLRADNSKTYWTAHKDVYESQVRQPMHLLLEQLAPRFEGTAVLFRPYRDVRFAKDKSPYKTAQGGFVELAAGVGYYVQLDADAVLVGGGFHAHDKDQTARYRAAVDRPGSGAELAQIVADVQAAGFTIGGPQVRTRPRGVPPDHPRLDLMRREHLTAGREVPPGRQVAGKAFATKVEQYWRSVTPLVDWVLQHALPS